MKLYEKLGGVWSFLILLSLKIVDIVTTYYLVSKNGLECEANLIARYTMEKMGIDFALIVNFLIVIFCFGCLVYQLEKSKNKFVGYCFYVCLFICVVVALNNSLVVFGVF